MDTMSLRNQNQALVNNRRTFWGLTVPTIDCSYGFSSARNQFSFFPLPPTRGHSFVRNRYVSRGLQNAAEYELRCRRALVSCVVSVILWCLSLRAGEELKWGSVPGIPALDTFWVE